MIVSAIEDVTDPLEFRDALRRSEIRYRRLFEAAHDGVLILDAVSRKITDANPFMDYLLGYPHGELLGKELWEIGLLKDEQASQDAFRELQQKGQVRYEDLPLETKSGDRREVEIVANRYEEDGKQVIQCNIRDITERKRTEELLRENQTRLRFALESAQLGDWDLDLTNDTARRSLRHDKAFGYDEPIEDWGFEKFIQHVHPEDRPEVERQFQNAVTQQKDWHFESRVIWPDGGVRWIEAHGSLYRARDGEPTHMLGIVTNITGRKQAEERQRFLMGELAHRGGNLLAVIQSIVSRSLSGTRPFNEERETLTNRIQALARSQSVLMNEGFEGAPVAEILRLEFEAFSDRVTAVGPDVMLNSRTAQTFALLVHELATNASKYGALSRPKKGHVDIHWSVEGTGEAARFKFQWQERDGPPVVPPTRQGFGNILLEKVAAQDFGALPKIRFAPEGLSYEIDAPLLALTTAGPGNPIIS